MSSAPSDNPILQTSGIPAYDTIQASHVEAGITEMLKLASQFLESAEQCPVYNWDRLMAPLEKIDLLYEYGWSPVEHLLSVVNSNDLRQAHEAVLSQVVQFGLRIGQSHPLYKGMCGLRDSEAWNKLSECRQRIVTRAIRNAELSGVGLNTADQKQFNKNQQRLSQLATDFSNHVLDATKAFHLDITERNAAEGLPDSYRRMAAAAWSQAAENEGMHSTPESGPWRITLDAPSFGPFMQYCRIRELRETVYRACIFRASTGETNNEPLIDEILKLRKEQANLLGFDSYAQLSLSRKMADGLTQVDAMFSQLLQTSFDKGRDELNELTEFANTQGHDGPLSHWDVAFWAERLREKRYAFTDEELRPYFSLDRVLDGLFELCERLFAITVRRADKRAPLWHDDVRYYEIDNENGDYIAAFYLDAYSRPENKRDGAWMNDCIARSVTQSETRLPIAHLVCNVTPPVGNVPSLMTFREVETLFHEFGHGLQHMMTVIDDRSASGINGVEWDAVELPSQFMENWCYHRSTLLGMAVHHETGETLPEELFHKICEARTYRAASAMLRQLQLGMIDMHLHSSFDPKGSESAFDVFQRICDETSPMPALPENRFLCSFHHIFSGGYAAGYYSYKWAEVLSADAFGAFEEAGLDDEAAVAEIGRRFRETVLAQGGSRHPMEIFQEFRGRKPSVEALLRHSGLTT